MNEIIITPSPRGYRVEFPFCPSQDAIRGFHAIGMAWRNSPGSSVTWSIPADKLDEAIERIHYWYGEPVSGESRLKQVCYGVRVEGEVKRIAA